MKSDLRRSLPVLVVIAVLTFNAADAAEARRESFGATADGTAVTAVVLSNQRGFAVRILSLGATIQSLQVPDREGQAADVVLGYSNAADYLDKPQYFGSTVGRFANRIGGARFELDGRVYELEANDGDNHLHGGQKFGSL